ncbi:MAG: hypothetical protein IPK22_25535 [Verrucomicrobiaceae bacterium]|nr:hypothetical protein [Verrucomicrobiaceae bacterium]
MPSPHIPPTHPSIRLVSSFDELLNTPLRDGVNALCWPRCLAGDFTEVAQRLPMPLGITHLAEEDFCLLELSAEGHLAADQMLADLHVLQEHGLDPVLDSVNGCSHPILGPYQRTDVGSWHVDSATAEADTWLCTYHGASSEGLFPEDAIPRIEMPEARAELLRLFGGRDDETFTEWLDEHFHDLHYAARESARPYVFGIGNLWRIATRHPEVAVPPCVHRAPDSALGQKRLLLIS